MSAIKQFVNEIDLGIDFYDLFFELADQEGVGLSDVAAFFYRNRSKLIKPEGMHNSYISPNYICYSYNKLKGFDPAPNEDFQSRSLTAIKAIAEGCRIDEVDDENCGFTLAYRGNIAPDHYSGLFMNIIFRKDEISKFLDDLGVRRTRSLLAQDEVLAVDEVFKDKGDVTWGNFAGKDTALMLIAGMAIALEKSGAKYSRAGKPNKSAIERAAREAINDVGHGTKLSERALTNLLAEALKANLHSDS
ncbi:TPA: hypothetical protein MDE87_001771 [Klebsiella pneumoniae]|uniref:hypothetical protein n=1 Tax=Klebsiella quasipneumoniae TaxID=1463165 RepID=UPI0015E8954D|nr:hypothetical protein [Klebsiella quasipneumoniae]EKZ9998777.1 hypothetical protein [Klebsiella pneumoniae]HBU8750147.1 hypothetical protein [Klebsiella pneumoniae]HBW4998647.1 hypothetical protein [Klebsiella pneumoniae]HBW5335222.1 hypothetical protein [Klebsiella pneumoniae]HBW5633246.1 hypothetical protein [Klebsiella pneumoniae]